MEGYLKKNSISYNAYVKAVYNGTIWADNYMIGALSRMFNVKITVVSPYYSDVWNVFHKSAIPDIIIVSNGGDFGARNGVTHFTATRGTETVWRCVGSEISVGEVGLHTKESDGRAHGINVFEVSEKKRMTIKAQKLTKDIEELSKDLKEICLRRDQILDEMSDIKVDVEELKRFTRYHPETERRHSHKRKAQGKVKSSKPEKKKKPFPTELREKLMKDVTEGDPFDFSDIQELKMLYEPAIKRCRTKEPGQSAPSHTTVTSLELPSLKDVEDVFGEIPTDVLEQVGTVTEHGMPNLREAANEEVITHQPKRTIDEFFPKTKTFSEEVQVLPKLSELPATADHHTRVNYSGIPMSKEVAERLEEGKKEKAHELATVHTSSKKNVTCGETYVDVEIDPDGNVLASNSEVNIFVPGSDKKKETVKDDKTEEKVELEADDVIEVDDSEKETGTTKKILQPTAAEIEAYKVTVTVPVDISKLPPPVPEGKQDPNFFYCTMCDKKFRQKRHQKTHIEEYCKYLTEVVKIQCPHGECGHLFTHVRNFRDHLSSKHGAEKQYQCMKCGMKFDYQKTYSRHIVNC